MTTLEILVAASMGSIWAWSISSAKLIQLIMQNNLSVLPMWVFEKKYYITLSIINFALLLLQYGLPISLFFFFAITKTLLILLIAYVFLAIIKFTIQLISKGDMLINYYMSAIISIICIIITINLDS